MSCSYIPFFSVMKTIYKNELRKLPFVFPASIAIGNSPTVYACIQSMLLNAIKFKNENYGEKLECGRCITFDSAQFFFLVNSLMALVEKFDGYSTFENELNILTMTSSIVNETSHLICSFETSYI